MNIHMYICTRNIYAYIYICLKNVVFSIATMIIGSQAPQSLGGGGARFAGRGGRTGTAPWHWETTQKPWGRLDGLW